VRQAIGDRIGLAESLEGLAAVASATSNPRAAVTLWAGLERMRGELGAPLTRRNSDSRKPRIAAARNALGTEAYRRAWQAGAAMTLEQAIRYALGEAEP
jgi:hypothetical protein